MIQKLLANNSGIRKRERGGRSGGVGKEVRDGRGRQRERALPCFSIWAGIFFQNGFLTLFLPLSLPNKFCCDY